MMKKNTNENPFTKIEHHNRCKMKPKPRKTPSVLLIPNILEKENCLSTLKWQATANIHSEFDHFYTTTTSYSKDFDVST